MTCLLFLLHNSPRAVQTNSASLTKWFNIQCFFLSSNTKLSKHSQIEPRVLIKWNTRKMTGFVRTAFVGMNTVLSLKKYFQKIITNIL